MYQSILSRGGGWIIEGRNSVLTSARSIAQCSEAVVNLSIVRNPKGPFRRPLTVLRVVGLQIQGRPVGKIPGFPKDQWMLLMLVLFAGVFPGGSPCIIDSICARAPPRPRPLGGGGGGVIQNTFNCGNQADGTPTLKLRSVSYSLTFLRCFDIYTHCRNQKGRGKRNLFHFHAYIHLLVRLMKWISTVVCKAKLLHCSSSYFHPPNRH